MKQSVLFRFENLSKYDIGSHIVQVLGFLAHEQKCHFFKISIIQKKLQAVHVPQIWTMDRTRSHGPKYSTREVAKSVLDGCFTSDASAKNAGSRNKPSFILLQLLYMQLFYLQQLFWSPLMHLDPFSRYLYEQKVSKMEVFEV